MALMCPGDLDVATLRNEIRMMHGRVSAHPDGEFHFHRGPETVRASSDTTRIS